MTPEDVNLEFVDTHCHLDDDAFKSDLDTVITKSRASAVRRFINIGYEPESWARTLRIAERYPDVAYALGLHPSSASIWSPKAASALADHLGRSCAVAIGETGLDYYRGRAERSVQRAAFRDQMEIARQVGLPVVIHMRGDVESEIVDILTSFPDVRAVFHSFDGTPNLRDFALARGDYFGVGGLLTRAGSTRLRETIAAVPLDHLLLETDSPYLTPKGVKERRNTPASIPIIARRVADLFGIQLEDVAAQTTANAERFFSLRQAIASGPSR